MSQQEFSYFDPEQEAVYEPREINRDPRESYERQKEPEQIAYYVTPEQSMLRGQKLTPTKRTKSYANWIATAVFLLMLIIGGLIWSMQASAYPVNGYGGSYYQPNNQPPYGWHHRYHHRWHDEQQMPPQDDDDDGP